MLDAAEQVGLLDGTEVAVRRLDTGDIDAVLQLHNRLTDREQYFRFFTPHPKYLRKFANEIVKCDDKRCALGAFDSGQLIGVASYAKSSEEGVAEIAVAVAHEDHLRGVATTLLRRLAELAVANGVRFFAADVLAENRPMLKVLSDAGWRHAAHFDGEVVRIRTDLAKLEINGS